MKEKTLQLIPQKAQGSKEASMNNHTWIKSMNYKIDNRNRKYKIDAWGQTIYQDYQEEVMKK